MVQHIYLTATLPPSLEAQFTRALLLQQPSYKRTSTRRPNIGYSVLVCANEGQVNETISSLIDSRPSTESAVIVYCRYKSDVDFHAKRLGCPGFYGGHARGEENLKSWLDGTATVLVATGALGAGINMPNIDLVIHMNMPYGLIDYSQESGRAGRCGQPAKSVIVTCRAWEKRLRQAWENERLTWDMNARQMYTFMLTTQCRRLAMDSWMDGVTEGKCGCRDLMEISCDKCSQIFGGNTQGWGEPFGSEPTNLEQSSPPIALSPVTVSPNPRNERLVAFNPLNERNMDNAAKSQLLIGSISPSILELLCPLPLPWWQSSNARYKRLPDVPRGEKYIPRHPS